MATSSALTRIRFLLLLAGLASGGAAADDGTLIVQFVGMQSDQGSIACSLVDSREHFLSNDHQPKRKHQAPISANKATWTISKLTFGHYAITAYHDANSNGELDTGLFSIPAEDYGFSNNVRGGFGPPGYDAALFKFTESGQTLTIRIE